METITGYVDHIIYRNADNGYTVLVLVCEEEEITCVGIFSGISEGENIEVTGEYTAHPTYGKQFKAESYVEKEPTDELSIERYLGSGAIKGIGAALAARIVRRFKGDTFRIIEEEPERLAEVKGISERKAMEISDLCQLFRRHIANQYSMTEALFLLTSLQQVYLHRYRNTVHFLYHTSI